MKLIELADNLFSTGPHAQTVTLYHGTCRGKALALDRHGFNPTVMSRDKDMVLVSTMEMAKEQALKNKCDAIVKVSLVNIRNIMPLKYSPMTNPNGRQDMVDAIMAGEDVVVRLVKKHGAGQFEYVNKLRRPPKK